MTKTYGCADFLQSPNPIYTSIGISSSAINFYVANSSAWPGAFVYLPIQTAKVGKVEISYTRNISGTINHDGEGPFAGVQFGDNLPAVNSEYGKPYWGYTGPYSGGGWDFNASLNVGTVINFDNGTIDGTRMTQVFRDALKKYKYLYIILGAAMYTSSITVIYSGVSVVVSDSAGKNQCWAGGM